jgi:hypothetical protein
MARVWVSRAAVEMQQNGNRHILAADIGRGEDTGLGSAKLPLPEQVSPPVPPRPDGVEGGCWLWWNGKRHDIPKGVVYRLIAFMWDKDSAGYDSLDGPVFEEAVYPATLRARTCEANRILKKIGIPWRLKTDAMSRILTKRRAP